MPRRSRSRRDADAVSITSASRPHSEDLRGRERRYVISMGVRTGCFLLSLVFIGTWLVWVFLAAAIFLPYIAVVIANAGDAADPDPEDHAFTPDHKALDAGPDR